MKINLFHSRADQHAGEIVTTALVRSFTTAQVTRGADPAESRRPGCRVWINPSDEEEGAIGTLISTGGKALLLGRIGPRIAERLGLELLGGEIQLPAAWAECQLDPQLHHDASPAAIRYDGRHPLARTSPLGIRPLCRFDFANEWNNLGFGRVTLDGGPWSLQSNVSIGRATSLAQLTTPADDRLVFAALSETAHGAALWFNRAVGPVDSLEWRVVESFLGDYRAEDLPCFPYLSEIPAGYSGAVNARLDCDEAVGAARPLAELYLEHGLPLSLALLTGQPLDGEDLVFLRQLIAQGGSVVSHSVHHQPNWGGSYERAREEAQQSRAWFDEHLPEALPVRYAVSPFHQNPPYAVSALADCGYEGFVGGIIANDPEYLLGRAGRVPFVSRPMVSKSAQCMMHGDCYHRYGDSVDVYCESFDKHWAGRSIFGYLDHPFSARYQYGWPDETTRLTAHRRLIEHVARRPEIWWPSLNEMMDFLCRRDQTLVEEDPSGRLQIERPPGDGLPPLAILWKGQQFAN